MQTFEDEEQIENYKQFLKTITSYHLGESLEELGVNELAKIYNELESSEPDRNIIFEIINTCFENYKIRKFQDSEGIE